MGDLVTVGAEGGVWEVSAQYFNLTLEPIYMLRKDGQLREVKADYITRYTGIVDDLR